MGLVMDGCLPIKNQVVRAQKWPRETHLHFLPQCCAAIQRCSTCPKKVQWMSPHCPALCSSPDIYFS